MPVTTASRSCPRGCAVSSDVQPVLGVYVAGWPAHVLDKLKSKYLDPHLPAYLGVMDSRQRTEVRQTRSALRVAAVHWATVTADGSTEVTEGARGARLGP